MTCNSDENEHQNSMIFIFRYEKNGFQKFVGKGIICERQWTWTTSCINLSTVDCYTVYNRKKSDFLSCLNSWFYVCYNDKVDINQFTFIPFFSFFPEIEERCEGWHKSIHPSNQLINTVLAIKNLIHIICTQIMKNK